MTMGRESAPLRRLAGSLRVRLIGLIVLALLPLAGLVFYNARVQRRAGAVEAQAGALRLARICAANHERVIEGSRQLLAALAQVPSVRAQDAAASGEVFRKIREQDRIYANIGVIDRRGIITVSALPLAGEVSVADRKYFQRAVATREFAVGDFQIGRVTGRAAINVAYPILENGEVEAVVFAAIDLGWLNGVAARLELPEEAALTVIDQTGTIVARYPEPEKWTGQSAAETPVGRALLAGGAAEGTAKGPGVDGKPRLYSYTTLGAGGLTVSVGLPERVALMPAREGMWRSFALLGCVAAVALAGAWILGDALVLRPIRRLLRATRGLAAGDFAARSGLAQGQGELAHLARAFDEMAESLERGSGERDAAQEALRQSEKRFRNLFEFSPDPVFVEDLEGNVLDVNVRACHLHQMERAELIGRNVRELVPPEVQREVDHIFRHWATTGVTTVESKSLAADGTIIPVELRASRIEYAGRQALLFHVRDITARLAASEALERAHEELERRVEERTAALAEANDEMRRAQLFLNNIVENIPHMIFVKDARKLRFVRINRAGETLLGVRRLDMIGKSDHDFFPPEEVEFFIAKDRAVLASGKMQDIPEEPIQTPRGTRILHTKKLPIMNQAGEPEYLLGISEDITERREAEEALQRRTEELARSNEELAQFAYVASHDLQEPLRMVASYTQLLERRYADQLDETAREFIGFAVDGAKRMQGFINDLLEYSRVGSRQRSLERVDLGEPFATAVANLRAAIEESGAEITHDSLPTLPGDAARLAQLFQNLLGNALKFRGERAPRIHVSARRIGRRWRISVADNGIGIDSENFDRIFVIFQRLHSRADFAGTGIGLALCKKIVERHGGRIWVESRPGEGTTFHFTLSEKAPTG